MLGAQKNAVQSDCVKSTPKEEGGGDTIWTCARLKHLGRGVIDPTDPNYADPRPLPQHIFVRRGKKISLSRSNPLIDEMHLS